MKTQFLAATSALALALAPSPAMAQQMNMPGMTMPQVPPAKEPKASPTMPMDHSGMDMGHGEHAMTGALGSYPSTREASGTAWEPDTSEHEGLMTRSGDWMLMAHGNLTAVTSIQGGPRGDSKAFVEGMLMGMARRDFANGDDYANRVKVTAGSLDLGDEGCQTIEVDVRIASLHGGRSRSHPPADLRTPPGQEGYWLYSAAWLLRCSATSAWICGQRFDRKFWSLPNTDTLGSRT